MTFVIHIRRRCIRYITIYTPSCIRIIQVRDRKHTYNHHTIHFIHYILHLLDLRLHQPHPHRLPSRPQNYDLRRLSHLP